MRDSKSSAKVRKCDFTWKKWLNLWALVVLPLIIRIALAHEPLRVDKKIAKHMTRTNRLQYRFFKRETRRCLVFFFSADCRRAFSRPRPPRRPCCAPDSLAPKKATESRMVSNRKNFGPIFNFNRRNFWSADFKIRNCCSPTKYNCNYTVMTIP